VHVQHDLISGKFKETKFKETIINEVHLMVLNKKIIITKRKRKDIDWKLWISFRGMMKILFVGLMYLL